jgi:hypothetical protein
VKSIVLLIITAIGIPFSCSKNKVQPVKKGIRAYNIDYNWDSKGGYINSFAKPGLWADANPKELMDWYEALGCNTVHSFAVSCNGYSWYKNAVIPEQPGLKYDFLTDMVKIGHKRNMKVFGYYCVGANTQWGLDHPDLSYGTPSEPHIPFTIAYLDYLCASIEDAIQKTDMDGVMLDWIWTPSGWLEPYKPVRWLACEQDMYQELLGEPFPGIGKVSAEKEVEFRAKSIARCWRRIYKTVKETKSNCLIWITCNNIMSPDVANSEMFKQTDWLMNEAGDIASTEAMKNMVGKETELITCLAEWNGQDPAIVAPAAIKSGVAVYGFTKPLIGYAMPPVDMYLNHSIDAFRGDNRNLAVIARAFHSLPLDTVLNQKEK